MGIQEDIKQSKFKSEYQKLFINIAYTNSYLTSILSTELKSFDLSMQQFNVLRILRGQHPTPVSINAITERMIDKMSNASRLVEKLHNKGLIERRTCEEDRRQVDVMLSTKGMETLETLDGLLPNFESRFSHIPVEDARKVNEVLDALRNK